MREKILRDKEMRRRKAAEDIKKDEVNLSYLVTTTMVVSRKKNNFHLNFRTKNQLMIQHKN